MYDLDKGWILISSASHYCTKTRKIGRSGLLMGFRLFQEPHQSDRYLAQPRPSSGRCVRPADTLSVQRTRLPSSGRPGLSNGHFVRPTDTTNSGNRQTKLSTILLNKTSKSEALFNKMVLSFFVGCPKCF